MARQHTCAKRRIGGLIAPFAVATQNTGWRHTPEALFAGLSVVAAGLVFLLPHDKKGESASTLERCNSDNVTVTVTGIFLHALLHRSQQQHDVDRRLVFCCPSACLLASCIVSGSRPSHTSDSSGRRVWMRSNLSERAAVPVYLSIGPAGTGRSLDETVDDVKEVPPIQRGVSSVVSKISSRGSGSSFLGKGYEPPVKPLNDSLQGTSAQL